MLHGPTLRTVDLRSDERLRQLTSDLARRPPEWLVATTGFGIRMWLEAADGWGVRDRLLEALARSRIVARGPKSRSALRQAGLEPEWTAPGESMADILDHLGADRPALAGTRLALQLFDPDDHPATTELRQLVGDGELVEIPLYRWLLPSDTGPAEHLIEEAIARRLDAVTFTSQPAVRFMFRIAATAGREEALREALNGGVLPVCIGPVCAEAARECGITDPVWPEPFRLAPMVRLTAERLGAEPDPVSPSPAPPGDGRSP